MNTAVGFLIPERLSPRSGTGLLIVPTKVDSAQTEQPVQWSVFPLGGVIVPDLLPLVRCRCPTANDHSLQPPHFLARLSQMA